MSSPYSATRPATATSAQNPEFMALQSYAFQGEVQDLLQNMLTQTFLAKPDAPIDFMIQWLQEQKAAKGAKGK